MKRNVTIFLILLLSIPAFTGYPLHLLGGHIIPGITRGWILYFCLVNAFIGLFLGARALGNAVGIASLITAPVVFFGSGISYLMVMFQTDANASQETFSAHYVSLCITMLTVVPLALSLVSTLPLHQMEHRLLKAGNTVSRLEKFLLMFLRVFNHVSYFVVPEILEVIREENFFRFRQKAPLQPAPKSGIPISTETASGRWYPLISGMIHVGVESVCASLRFIPIWAVEIARLPERKKGAENEPDETG